MSPWYGPFRDPLYLGALVALIVLATIGATVPSTRSDASRPPATAVTATAAPTSTPTPDADADAQRARDLATLAEALDQYFVEKGEYPSTTGDFQTLCFSAWDAGCQLLSVTKEVPASDGETPYWYVSDGAGYTLFAPASAGSGDDDCPAQRPPKLVSPALLCRSGGVR